LKHEDIIYLYQNFAILLPSTLTILIQKSDLSS